LENVPANVNGFVNGSPSTTVVVFIVGGGKLSFWPEKLPGLTELITSPPGKVDPIICDTKWRTAWTYWWIF
jgi:hypothetical protein